MIEDGKVDRPYLWIDCYSDYAVADIANTVTAGVDFRNIYFITVPHTKDRTPKENNIMIVQINLDKREAECFDIRKLTPRECGRLMGVPESFLDRLLSGPLANSALYKLFGNAIVVDVMTYIFEELLYPTGRRAQGETVSLFDPQQFRLERDWQSEPFRLVSLCSGIETQGMALDMLQQAHPDFRWQLTAWAEFDPESRRPLDEQPAVIAHNLCFPDAADRNLGDMTRADWESLHTTDIDLLTYSTPCFVAGTLVLTADGLKPIEDIGDGDRVLTHTNQYRQVVTPMQRQYDGDVVTVKPMFCDEIRCTDNHPFYVRTRYRHGHKWLRAFREPEWKEAARLTKDDYLGYAVNTESRLPDWHGTVLNFGGRHTFNPQRLRPVLEKEDFWYLMGRYLGDGWVRDDKTHKAMIICSSAKSEADWLPIQRALENLGWRYTLNRERTTLRFTVYGKELAAFCQRYGKGAAAKHIDADTMALPSHLLRYFIMGYKDSDGHFGERDRSYHFTSVSYPLLLGLGQCIAKVYHRPFSITHCAMPHTTEIEGRRVSQRDFYVMRFKETNDPQDKAFYEDGYLWMPINHIEHQREMVTVYNMEVSADHSYTANGAIVHNCQSISQAGKREGIAKGSGTRSSVLWSTEDAVRVLRPKVLLQENVAALINQQNRPHFRQWCSVLEALGYRQFLAPAFPAADGKTKPCILNAKHYGVPQNRDRIFMLSVREDLLHGTAYEYPRPVPLTRCIADVLEDDVPATFFLKPTSVTAFLTKNEDNQRYLYMVTDHVPTAEEIREYIKEYK